jgi:hypothetical protein
MFVNPICCGLLPFPEWRKSSLAVAVEITDTLVGVELAVGTNVLASQIIGPGFFVPTRDGELLRWLLGAGMRAAWPATLMSLGPYQPPAGAFLPSIAF